MAKPFTGFLWMGWLWSWGSMGRIEADIALESWLFRFRPCSGQVQFSVYPRPSNSKWPNLEQGWNASSQLSTAISAPNLPIESQDQDHAWTIHRNPVQYSIIAFQLGVGMKILRQHFDTRWISWTHHFFRYFYQFIKYSYHWNKKGMPKAALTTRHYSLNAIGMLL